MLCAAPVELPAPSSLAGTPPGRHHPLTPATVDSAASVSYAEHSASLPRPPRSARPTRISLPRTTEPFARKASKVPARPGQGEIDPAVLARRAELASTRAAAASTAPLAGATGHFGPRRGPCVASPASSTSSATARRAYSGHVGVLAVSHAEEARRSGRSRDCLALGVEALFVWLVPGRHVCGAITGAGVRA